MIAAIKIPALRSCRGNIIEQFEVKKVCSDFENCKTGSLRVLFFRFVCKQLMNIGIC